MGRAVPGEIEATSSCFYQEDALVPILTVVAGANGAGKSTITRFARELFQADPVLDPDALAKASHIAGSSSASPIDAGRTVLQLAAGFLDKGDSFLIETTLAGHTHLRMMRRARSLGYEIRLLYVGTDSVDINRERIKERVRRGGHDVPEEDQRRRYPRSFANLKSALQLAHEAILFDNSSPEGPRTIAVKSSEGLQFYAPVPAWANGLDL